MSDLEKNDNTRSHDFQTPDSRDEALQKVRTAGSLSISPELFEQLYLSPKTRVKGQMRAILGNPSPLGILGFSVSLGPASCVLMNFRGTPGTGASQVGVWYAMGGVLMLIASIFELIVGNTFTFVAFGTYGGWWIAQAITSTPFFNAATAYEPSNPLNPTFHASFAFAILFMGLATFIFMICSLRTNVTFFLIFVFLLLGFGLLSGSYWQVANLNTELAHQLQVAAGACYFVADLLGWYSFLFMMLAAVEFPWNVALGDLTHIIPAAKDKVE